MFIGGRMWTTKLFCALIEKFNLVNLFVSGYEKICMGHPGVYWAVFGL